MFLHGILGDQPILRACIKNKNLALRVTDIQTVSDQQHRSPEGTAQSLLPDRLSRLDVNTLGNARCIGDVKISVMDDSRSDSL